MRFRETDRHVTYVDQLAGDDGPVELVDVVTVDATVAVPRGARPDQLVVDHSRPTS